MTVGPRITFARFADADSPKLQPWTAHYQRVTQRRVRLIDEQPDGCVVVWQLISANNRILARSADVFGGFDSAVTNASATIDRAARLEFVAASDERIGAFGWYAVADSDVMMTCSRFYSAERDRRHSIALATASIAIASLGPGARPIHPGLMTARREAVGSESGGR